MADNTFYIESKSSLQLSHFFCLEKELLILISSFY